MDIRGRKILIVEDDFFQAQDIAGFFQMTGAEVLGPALSVEQAMPHAQAADAAILDMDLSGARVFPVADLLMLRATPFVFYSGYAAQIAIPARFRDTPVVPKPVMPARLRQAFDTLPDTPPRAEGEEPIPDILPKLRLAARLICHDPAAADRLVERALAEAITALRAGQESVPPAMRSQWLLERMQRLADRTSGEMLN